MRLGHESSSTMSPQTPASDQAYGDMESGPMFPATTRQQSLLHTPHSRIDDDMDPVQLRNALALLGDEQVIWLLVIKEMR